MERNLRKLAMFAPLTLALMSPAVGQEMPAQASSLIMGTRLDIVATGEVAAIPDIATIGAGVVTQEPTAAAAMSENSRRTAATVAAIRKAGVADRDIQTTTISLSPQYKYVENQPPMITGYQASSRVSVRFRDIKAAGRILDSLVTAGANQIDGPSLTIDKPEPLLDEARARAVAAAKARATLYAKAAGLQVKRIVAISEGSSDPITRPMPMMMVRGQSKEADTSIEAGEQKLAISLAVTFELN